MEIHIQFILQNNWLGLKMWNVRKQISCAMKCFNLRKLQSTCEKKPHKYTSYLEEKCLQYPFLLPQIKRVQIAKKSGYLQL